jgi:hypothetical protein
MLALFLGAGFSKWAADLPLASQLFDLRIRQPGLREQPRLERVRNLQIAWNAKNPAGRAEQFIGEVLSSNNARNHRDLIWYVVRRLSEPYIWEEWHAQRMRRHVLMIDENRKWDRPGVRIAEAFIAECYPNLAGIVTLNYDLLAEYALGSKQFNYGILGEVLQGRGPYPLAIWGNPVQLTGRLPIAKLHGSISWDTEAKYTDGRRGLTGQALIIAPTPEKVPPKKLEQYWTLSSEVLSRAVQLLVFGFGFNEYDEAVLAHLADAGRHLVEVAIVDVGSREAAAARLWPNARINSFLPPPPELHQLRAWWSILRNTYRAF